MGDDQNLLATILHGLGMRHLARQAGYQARVTPERVIQNPGSKNKSQKTPKAKRLMTKRSRAINRRINKPQNRKKR